MATNSHTQIIDQTQTLTPGALVWHARRFRFGTGCRSADDVRERAALVRAWRAKVWPVHPPRIAEPPAPPPPPVQKAPVRLPTEPLFIQLGDRRYPVDSLKQASEMYCAARDAFGEGASCTPEVPIVTADGRAVARISYNGKVWPAEEKPGEKPLYDPAAESLPAVPGRITVGHVLEAAAEHFGITVEGLVSHSRKQPLVRRRQVAMFVAWKATGRSLPFIASKMGGRDHTTILHGKRTVEALLDAGDAETVAAVDAIVERLMGGAND